MEGNNTLLLLVFAACLFLKADAHLVDGIVKVQHGNLGTPVADGKQRCLVHHVGKVCTRKAHGTVRNGIKVNVIVKLHLFGVDTQDGFAALYIRAFHRHLAVKAAGAQQCRVKHVRTVGGGQNDEAFFVVKAVHLYKQLVQRLFTLVIADKAVGAAFAHGIDFVDEYDARRLFTRGTEKVADAACTHAYKHFHKVGTADAEEGNARFTGNGACQQGFARTRRPHQKHALGNLSADIRVFLGGFQEVHNFHQLFLCIVHTGNVGKARLHLALVHGFGAAVTAAEHGTADAAAHFAENEPVHKEDKCKRNDEIQQNLQQVVVLPRNEFVFHSLFVQQVDEGLHQHAGGAVHILASGFGAEHGLQVAVHARCGHRVGIGAVPDKIIVAQLNLHNLPVRNKLAEFRKVDQRVGLGSEHQVQHAKDSHQDEQHGPEGEFIVRRLVFLFAIVVYGKLEEAVGVKIVLVLFVFPVVFIVAHSTSTKFSQSAVFHRHFL